MNIDIEDRLRCLRIEEKEHEALRSLQPLIGKVIPEAIAAYDTHAQQWADYQEVRQRLAEDLSSAAMVRYWQLVLSGRFDDQHVRRTGERAARQWQVKFPPRWSFAAYALILDPLISATVDSSVPAALHPVSEKWRRELATKFGALFKSAMFEMDMTTTAYRGCGEADRKKLDEQRREAAAAHEHAVGGLTKGLDDLAQGDLTVRLSDIFAPQYEKLRIDFNASVERLQTLVLQVAAGVGSIRAGSEEISAASDHLSKRTEQQAASLVETASALAEIVATVHKTAEGANHANNIVSVAKIEAEKSSDIVRHAIEAVRRIEKSSQEIGQIIGVIDEIAFQTNLLALNAGVEAARAADKGRGFAVVASEVRALAQRSAEAAKEIKSLISTAKSQVDQGVELVDQTGHALDRIVAQVTKVNNVVSDIAARAREQAVGLQEVNAAVSQMDQVTQQNAAMVEETTAAGHSLKQETEHLLQSVACFNTGEKIAQDGGKAKSRNSSMDRSVATPAARLKLAARRAGDALARKIAPQSAADGWEEF
ncbi:MAG: methyl-accepting chemotaxis protein [Beijerinckiaceae bacterium]